MNIRTTEAPANPMAGHWIYPINVDTTRHLFEPERVVLFMMHFIEYRLQSGDRRCSLLSDSPLFPGGVDTTAAGGLLSIPFLPSAFSTICKTAPIIGRIINTAMKIAQKGCSLKN